MNEQANDGATFFLNYFKARASGAAFEDAMIAAGATRSPASPRQVEPEVVQDVDGPSEGIEALQSAAESGGLCGFAVLQTMHAMVTATDPASLSFLADAGIDGAALPSFRKAFATIAVEALQLHLNAWNC